jgi:hypothetical protein
LAGERRSEQNVGCADAGLGRRWRSSRRSSAGRAGRLCRRGGFGRCDLAVGRRASRAGNYARSSNRNASAEPGGI